MEHVAPLHVDPSHRRSLLLQAAQMRYDERRKRSAIFGHSELFGEPAWDILLDLYIAHAKGKEVSVSSACIGSAVPPTTGLRWLGILQATGLVVREHDSGDQRRVLVRLSHEGIEKMEAFLTVHGPRGHALHMPRREPGDAFSAEISQET